MKKKSLKLAELKVQSFVTDMDNRAKETIKGGEPIQRSLLAYISCYPQHCASNEGQCASHPCTHKPSLCHG